MYKKLIFPAAMTLALIFNNDAIGQTRISESQIDQFFSAWNKPGIPGATIAIVRDGKVMFKKGYGMANLELNVPVTSGTVFQIASASKQFTAFAVLLLADQGKLSLNDDIHKYLPELPDFKKPITIRHLLLHTDGMREYWDILRMAGWQYDDIITKDQMLKMLFRQKELNFVPGTEHVYSNTGYLLLSEIVSRVSGMPFSVFMRENIFKPLGMNNTQIMDDNERIVKNFASSYYLTPEGYKKSLLNHSNTGSTNLLTTVEDISLWLLNFDKPVVGDKELLQLMDTKGTLDNGDTINYAMGQETGPYRGLTLTGHRGAERGYRSFVGRFKDQDLSLVVLTNNSSIDPTSIALKVADILLKDDFKPEPELSASKPAESPDIYKGNISILKSFAGDYELRPGFVISITTENSRLYAEAHEVPRSQLIRKAESEFILPALRASLTFSGNDTTQVDKLIVDLNGQKMIAPKLKDFDVSGVNPADFTGDYFSQELGTVYTFVDSHDKLVVRHPRIADFNLTAVGKDKFSSDKTFCNRIEFVRDQQNKVTGCLLSAGRVRNIRFDKLD